MTNISTEELDALCMSALTKTGLDDNDARITVDHYLENEMSGKASHGMVRVIQAIEHINKYGLPSAAAETEQDNGSMLRINVHGNLGTVAGYKAMRKAIKRALEHGIAMIGAHNYIASSGSMAYYLRRIADAGLVGFMGCNSVALVAPPQGKERMIGTNPIGVCVPGEDTDFIADLATSAYAYGKIMVHQDKGEPVPEGVIIDAQGHPSTDPKDAYNGAMLPLAGFKGFSLGLMIELMAGPLIGAKAIKKDLCDEDGLFVIAIDPKAMGNTDFYKDVEQALKTVKNSAPAPGQMGVALSGERSAATLAKNKVLGEIDIADKTLEKLKELAA